MCLASAHDFVPHQDLALTVRCPGLACILLLLPFIDELLLFTRGHASVDEARLLTISRVVMIVVQLLVVLLLELLLCFEATRGWLALRSRVRCR